jgi:hypothetical protein
MSTFSSLACWQVTATDGDTGANALVTYSISDVSNSGASRFSIDSSSGRLSVVGTIVRDTVYTIIVQARDNPTTGQSLFRSDI